MFQQFNLVSRLSVLTNVLLGLLGQVPRWRGSLGQFTHEEKKRAMRALQRVGIEKHALKRGSELSGGQQQRAAIARTLLQGADVLIADEPIASLDPSSARRVMDILSDLNEHEGITVLVSLHQVEYALRYCPRTIALRNGEVVYDGPSGAADAEIPRRTLRRRKPGIVPADAAGRNRRRGRAAAATSTRRMVGARVPAGVLAQKVQSDEYRGGRRRLTISAPVCVSGEP